MPNGIQIHTRRAKLFLGSFFDRDKAYEKLAEAWVAAQRRKPPPSSKSQKGKRNTLVIDSTDSSPIPPYLHIKAHQETTIEPDFPTTFMWKDHQGFELSPDCVTTFRRFLDVYSANDQAQIEDWEVFLSKMALEHLPPPSPIPSSSTWGNCLEIKPGLECLLNKTVLESKELARLLRRGLPRNIRGEAWFILSGAYDKAKVSRDYYKSLQKRQSAHEVAQIEKDICRTFPNHGLYQTEEGKNCLRRVLIAYSVRNPGVGYCQSMNFIAAFLLLQMSEEKAFWTLAAIVENIMQEYFTSEMLGARSDQLVFENILKEKIPLLAQHFSLPHLEFPLTALTSKWFLCIFVNSLPTETVLRVWDWFMVEGTRALYLIAAAIMLFCEKALLEINERQDLLSFVNEATRNFFDADTLIKIAARQTNLFERQELSEMKLKFLRQLEVEDEQQMKKRRLVTISSRTHYKRELVMELAKEYDSKANSIDFADFSAILLRIAPGIQLSDLSAKALFKFFDRSEKDVIIFDQLMVGISVLLTADFDQKLEYTFKLFCQNQDSLSTESFCESVCLLYCVFLGNDYSTELLELYDVNDAHKQWAYVDFEEEINSSHSILAQTLKDVTLSEEKQQTTTPTPVQANNAADNQQTNGNMLSSGDKWLCQSEPKQNSIDEDDLLALE